MNLFEMRSDLRGRLRDVTPKEYSDPELDVWINSAQFDLARKLVNVERAWFSTSVVSASVTGDLALASDVQKIIRVQRAGVNAMQISEEDAGALDMSSNYLPDATRPYFIHRGSTLAFRPALSTTAVTYWYIRRPTRLYKQFVGTSTGGSATTYTCTATNFGGYYPDDYWNGAEIVVSSGKNVGQRAVVTDFTSTGGIVTFATGSFLSTPASGDNFYLGDLSIIPEQFHDLIVLKAEAVARRKVGGPWESIEGVYAAAIGEIRSAHTDNVDVRVAGKV